MKKQFVYDSEGITKILPTYVVRKSGFSDIQILVFFFTSIYYYFFFFTFLSATQYAINSQTIIHFMELLET